MSVLLETLTSIQHPAAALHYAGGKAFSPWENTGPGFQAPAGSHNLYPHLDLPTHPPALRFGALPCWITNPNRTRALRFYTLFEKRPYINYVGRIQVYAQFHQSINGVVNITLRIWYHEDTDIWRGVFTTLTYDIFISEMDIYIYTCACAYTYICPYIHTHIYTYICIKCF